MSCPHTETTAVLAAFGEAPPDFEAHLRACPACLAVVRQHTSTLAAIEPLIGQRPADPPRWTPPAIGFLLAAAVLLAFQLMPGSPEPVQPPAGITAQVDTVERELFDDPIDQSLTSLELELELFHLEES